MSQIEKFQKAEKILRNYPNIVPGRENCYCLECYGLSGSAYSPLKIGVFGAIYFACNPKDEENIKEAFAQKNSIYIDSEISKVEKCMSYSRRVFSDGTMPRHYSVIAPCQKFMSLFNSINKYSAFEDMMFTLGVAFSVAEPKTTLTNQFYRMNRWLKM